MQKQEGNIHPALCSKIKIIHFWMQFVYCHVKKKPGRARAQTRNIPALQVTTGNFRLRDLSNSSPNVSQERAPNEPHQAYFRASGG